MAARLAPWKARRNFFLGPLDAVWPPTASVSPARVRRPGFLCHAKGYSSAGRLTAAWSSSSELFGARSSPLERANPRKTIAPSGCAADARMFQPPETRAPSVFRA